MFFRESLAHSGANRPDFRYFVFRYFATSIIRFRHFATSIFFHVDILSFNILLLIFCVRYFAIRHFALRYFVRNPVLSYRRCGAWVNKVLTETAGSMFGDTELDVYRRAAADEAPEQLSAGGP